MAQHRGVAIVEGWARRRNPARGFFSKLTAKPASPWSLVHWEAAEETVVSLLMWKSMAQLPVVIIQ